MGGSFWSIKVKVLLAIVIALVGGGVAATFVLASPWPAESARPTAVPPPAPATSASVPVHLTWLAAGDSYAAGQGLTRTIEPCADGAGTAAAPSKTWAIVASESPQLASDHFDPPDLVACTGAKTMNFFSASGPDQPAQWCGPTASSASSDCRSWGRFDLVTFSFGGDNVGFASVILACFMHRPPCHDPTVRSRIEALGHSYPGFLARVANYAVVPGGNVVVMGYPDLFEASDLWSLPICQGITQGTADEIRGWAADLNATIGTAVQEANALPADRRNGVHFTFIDIVSGQENTWVDPANPLLYEPVVGIHHELCSPGNDSWLNGVSPLHLGTRSFHPDQLGEDAMGNLAADVISRLSWPWDPVRWHLLPGLPSPAHGAGPYMASCASDHFCMASNGADTVTTDGNGWVSASSPIRPWTPPSSSFGEALDGLSCVSATFCMAAYDKDAGTLTNYAVAWNGSSWGHPVVIGTTSGASGYGSTQGVSCVSATFCMATGVASGSAVWNGSSWRSVRAETVGVDDTGSASCTAPTFCLAVPGELSTSLTWNGSAWTRPKAYRLPPAGGLASITCSSPALCVGLAPYASNGEEPWVFDGQTWRAEGSLGDAASCDSSSICPNTFEVASCAPGGTCLAVNYGGTVIEWSGSSWQPESPFVVPPLSSNLDSLSCGATDWCLALSGQNAFVYVAGNDGPSPPPITAGSKLADAYDAALRLWQQSGCVPQAHASTYISLAAKDLLAAAALAGGFEYEEAAAFLRNFASLPITGDTTEQMAEGSVDLRVHRRVSRAM